jgi:hypothetical protein
MAKKLKLSKRRWVGPSHNCSKLLDVANYRKRVLHANVDLLRPGERSGAEPAAVTIVTIAI